MAFTIFKKVKNQYEVLLQYHSHIYYKFLLGFLLQLHQPLFCHLVCYIRFYV